MQTTTTFCRVCHASCPMEVDVEDNRVVAVRGVMDDPLFEGYTCIKGRQLPDQMADPNRLRAPLRRRPDGTFEEVTSAEALDEIAAELRRIIDTYGPRAVASYTGTGGYQNSVAVPIGPGVPRRPRLGVVLHVGHHRPTGQGPRRLPPRRLGGGLPQLHRLRRAHGHRLQPDGVVVRPDRRAAGHQPVRRHAPPQGRGHEADRRRSAPHRAGQLRRHPPADPARRGRHAARRHDPHRARRRACRTTSSASGG